MEVQKSMVSQQTIDIIIRAENRANAALEKVETQLANIRKLALGLNAPLTTASNGANRLNTNLMKVNPAPLRRVNEISVILQAALLLVAKNIRAVQNEMGRINGSSFKQIESNVKQLDTTLVATKGSANQLDRAFDTIDARAITVVDSQALTLKERLLSIIPSAEDVKMALQSIGNVNFNGLTEKINGVKTSLSGLGSSSTYATSGFTGLNVGSRLAGAGLGFLRNAASMTVGMIGYDLFNSVMESGRAAINASQQVQYFGNRLGMSATEIQGFNKELDGMQKEFKKVNMHAVGASAEEMAVKLNLGKESVKELTEVTAVMSSAFVKEGRTQEDAILAVSDAMDGQFKRLLELGIDQQKLMDNGWNGDLQDKNSLLQAMNKTLEEMGFTDTAKDITSLDDAYQALTVSGGILMEKILVPITPLLLSMAEAAMSAFDYIGGAIEGLSNAWSGLPDWAKDALGVTAFALAVSALAVAISLGMIPSISGLTISMITWVIEAMGGTLATESLSFAFSALAFNIWSALAPLLPFIAAAVLLGVAIYEVGKYFGWWEDIPSMIDAVKDGLRRLWEAFINNPNVQGFLRDLGELWDALCDALQPVVDWAKKVWSELFPPGAKFDIVRSIIDIFGALGRILGDVVNGIKIMYAKFGLIGAIAGIITAPMQTIVAILKTVICALLGCSPGIVPALEKVRDVFSDVWNAIAGFVGGVISTVVGYIQPLLDILTSIWEFLSSLFLPVWELIVSILERVSIALNMLIMAFELFLNGQITLPQLLTMIWNIILTTYMSILTSILSFVWQWASQLVSAAITAASNFVNNIISWISQLPGRVYSYITQTGSRILSGAATWVSNARQKASEMVTGVISNVSQLPDKVHTEFMNIGNRMLQAGSDLVNKARKIGEDIVNGLLDAMGIHSPGYIQEAVVTEFWNMVDKIKGVKGKAGEYAGQVGEAIVEKFGTPELGVDTENIMPLTDLSENVDVGMDMDTSSLGAGLDTSIGLTDDTNSQIGSSYAALAALMAGSMEDMVATDNLAYTTMQQNDLTAFSNIQTGLESSLLSMGVNLNTQLTNMNMTHTNAMNNANNTTRLQLANMLNQTVKVTGEMRSAWSVMASSIISAAQKIKTETTNYFNQLASTIGDFYVKLQNPSRWGGSSDGPSRPHGTPGSSLMSRITTGMANALRRDNQVPSSMSVSRASQYVSLPKGLLDYMGLTNSDNLSVNDLVRAGLINPLQLALLASAGGWADTAQPNINYIKNTAREWDMKGPSIMGSIDTGLAFKVKEFENGRPNISFGSFQRMAEALFSAIPYDFYYNSDKHGSWVNALLAGSCNCYDGANALIALARTCGFDGSIAHGTWNGIPHVYAVINGKKMDTTGWQQRRDWNGVAAGAPTVKYRRSLSNGNVIDDLKNTFSGDNSNTTSEEVKLTIEHNLNINLENIPEHVDEATIVRMINESTNDEGFVKKIAQNINFQKYDLKEKLKIERKNKRDIGVGI